MIPYNITPFTGSIDDPSRLKQMALVKALLKVKYDGKIEHLRTHILEFTRCIQNQDSIINLPFAPTRTLIPLIFQKTNGCSIILFTGKQSTSWNILAI
jgi:hypothetical protein